MIVGGVRIIGGWELGRCDGGDETGRTRLLLRGGRTRRERMGRGLLLLLLLVMVRLLLLQRGGRMQQVTTAPTGRIGRRSHAEEAGLQQFLLARI